MNSIERRVITPVWEWVDRPGLEAATVAFAEDGISMTGTALEHGRPWLEPEKVDTWLIHRLPGHSSVIAVEGTRAIGVVVAAMEDTQWQARRAARLHPVLVPRRLDRQRAIIL
jgi:hypothetical protein